MSFIKERYERLKMSFRASNLEITTDSADEQSPAIDNALVSLYNPKKGRIDSYDYIKFGNDDKMDMIFDALLHKSPTHSGILTKKSKMVAGNSLLVVGEESLSKSEAIDWDVFKSRCGGMGKSLYSVIKEAAYKYEKDGGVGLDITYDTGFSSIISIKVVAARELRCGIPSTKTNEVEYYVKRIGGFKRTSGGAIVAKEEKIAAFDLLNTKDLRQMIYIKNPLSMDDFYGIPNYLGAYYFIGADFEFGKHILNSARNGFTPKVLASFVGRNLSTDEKRNEARKFKSHFQGSEGEQVIISWVKKVEDMPVIKTLDIQNLDKTIETMAALDDAKILTAHNITSPTLFGIQVAGKLGGTGNELGTAYQLFRATETLPTRELIMESFNNIIRRTKYVDKLSLEIQDMEIDFGTKSTSVSNEKQIEKEASNE